MVKFLIFALAAVAVASCSAPPASFRAAALNAIAAAQAEAGDSAGAKRTALEAAKAARMAPPAAEFGYGIRELDLTPAIGAAALVRAGDVDGALAMAHAVPDSANGSIAVAAAAVAQGRAGDIGGAYRTAGNIPDSALMFAVCPVSRPVLAVIQAESGDTDGALRTAASIIKPDERAAVRYWVARAQANAGDLAGARATVEEILGKDSPGGSDDEGCGGWLGHYYIPFLLIASGDIAGYVDERVLRGGLCDAVFDFRTATIGMLAAAEAKSGNLARALDALEKIRGGAGPESVASASIALAAIRAQTGDISGALEVARAMAAGPDGKYCHRSTALYWVASAQADGGDWQGALQTAQSLATDLGQESIEDAYPAAIGVIVGVTGDHFSALREQILKVEDAKPFERNMMLTFLAAAQAESGDVAGALETAHLIE